MLKITDLDYKFPNELISTEPRPRGESRLYSISRISDKNLEVSWPEFFNLFKSGDLLILNNTEVFKARLMIENKEIFFLKTLSSKNHWQVLTKGYRGKEGKEILLPGDIRAKLLKAGKPAEIEILDEINFHAYFEKYGHVPLPPYILALRESHSDHEIDIERYQTIWAKEKGSVAAPTASLHFHDGHLQEFRSRGVDIDFITLHVGAGTFLPIETELIDDFKIHSEFVSVSQDVVNKIQKTKKTGKKIWACGTTVCRALESVKDGMFYSGETDLFIRPGFDFKIVDGLLTNFHQPQSSLLLLAAAFASPQAQEHQAVQKILKAYGLAIEKKFRLFSYGDLTVIS